MTRPLYLLAVLATLALTPLAAAAEPPLVYWYSDPVLPGEAVMVQGAGWDAEARVSLARVPDGPPGDPGAQITAPAPATLTPLDVNPRSLKFVLPENLEMGVFAARLLAAGGQSDLIYLNSPTLWWHQGDWGREASPGGWLRLFGRCLHLDGTTTVALRQAGQPWRRLPAEADLWSAAVDLPADLPAGEYEVWLHHGLGGPAGWGHSGSIVIRPHPPVWKDTVFNVVDYGALPHDDKDDSLGFTRALEAAAANGGGTVYFPEGRYYLTNGFTIPENVLLRGAGREATVLSWPDMAQPPDALLTGTVNFGLEDLSIFAINYNTVLRGGPAVPRDATDVTAGNIFLRRVIIRATLLTRWLNPEIEAPRRAQRTDTVRLIGENVQVTDCDIVGRYVVLGVGGRHTLVTRNRLYGDESATSSVTGARHIVEDNEYCGLSAFVQRCAKLYFARNHVQHIYRGFREGFSTDGTGGGHGLMEIAEINGAELTAARLGGRSEPQHTPGAVHILDGTGVGQWRRLVSWSGNTVVMDRPFDLPPDETSVVSSSNFMGRFLLIGNHWADTGIAVQFYGGAVDCVVAGNTSARSGGFRVWGQQRGPGPSPCWYVQLLDNEVLQGHGTEGPELAGGNSFIHIQSARGAPTYHGPMNRGMVVRRNTLHNAASITLRGPNHDVLVEGNLVRHHPVGIVADNWGGQDGILLRANRFEHVASPLYPLQHPFQIHPAEAILAGLAAAESRLPSVPGRWSGLRQDLETLARRDPREARVMEEIQAYLSAALQALPAGQSYPLGALQPLLGLDLSFDALRLSGLLLKGAGAQGPVRLNARLASWALPVAVSTSLEAPAGWELTPPPDLTLPPDAGVWKDFPVTAPAGVWAPAALPATFRVTVADGPALTLTGELAVGSGYLSEWLALGPFPADAPLPAEPMLPHEELNVGASYDSPAGRLTWQPLVADSLNVPLKPLLEGRRGLVYLATAVQASRPLRVSLRTDVNVQHEVFVNGRSVIHYPRNYRLGAATLQPGSNSLLIRMDIADENTVVRLLVEPLEPIAAGDLVPTPAAELSAQPALHPAQGPPAPEGPGLVASAGLNWKLVVQDPFERTRLGPRWRLPEGGAALLQEGRLTPPSFAPLVFGDPVTLPARVEFEVTPHSDAWMVGVALTPAERVTPWRLWYNRQGAGYLLTTGWHDRDTNQVTRETEEVLVLDHGLLLRRGQTSHVIAQFVPPTVTLLVDEQEVLSWEDENWLPSLDTVLFYCWGDLRLDNFRLYRVAPR